ncbi:hypothetical protein Glove_155g63 [Diversispora epigaea]|uniref:Serine-threonine/tyrosine-protein kinase catalytic domain-containing protein n=1 Tax=Diversispora epigaea TaxID=1348612 RepID=A0A397IYM5_9GLOM|nr:hypothetical protein Glove_155g63 [Diversispora epigaea]
MITRLLIGRYKHLMIKKEIINRKHFIREFRTWSNGNPNIDKIIQETQLNDLFLSYNEYLMINLDIKRLANGGHGSGNQFTREGNIYSFDGILYEIITAQHNDHLLTEHMMIYICNGIRVKVPDFMLNWIPEWYLDLMYRCWSDDSSDIAVELVDLFCDALNNTVDNNVTTSNC